MSAVIFLDVCNLIYYLRQSAFACTCTTKYCKFRNPITGLKPCRRLR